MEQLTGIKIQKKPNWYVAQRIREVGAKFIKPSPEPPKKILKSPKRSRKPSVIRNSKSFQIENQEPEPVNTESLTVLKFVSIKPRGRIKRSSTDLSNAPLKLQKFNIRAFQRRLTANVTHVKKVSNVTPEPPAKRRHTTTPSHPKKPRAPRPKLENRTKRIVTPEDRRKKQIEIENLALSSFQLTVNHIPI